MKISEPARPISSARSTAHVRPAVGAASAPAPAAPPATTVDTQGLLGIPAHELTPRVRDTLLTLMREVDSLRKDLERTSARLAELEKLADTDTLSPVANRRAFVRELSRVMAYAERYQVPTSILFFDLNGLKQINDSFGHAGGDAALVHVADVLRANIRGSDVVGRLGGDEYAVVLAHASEDQANLKAEQLSAKISERPIVFEGHEIAVAAAVGVYSFGPGETPTDVLAKADAKMYKNKAAMKGGTAPR
jgi:diguanylate cyclase (GGDEF)-like protein